jgi:phospholipase C
VNYNPNNTKTTKHNKDTVMSEIKHIVHLMLENRSFDQLLGWLYDEKNPPKINIPEQSPPTFDGLKENTYFNLDDNGNKHYITKGTANNMNVPSHDPHEEYEHINHQLFGSTQNPQYGQTATMGGFYQDFARLLDEPKEIMQTYTPQELPVLNGLARHYAVSDRYFCSVPTQTNCNRAFAACGNSLGINDDGQLQGWVNNRGFSHLPPNLTQPQGKQFNQKTLWNVLSDNGMNQSSDWMHYYSQGTWWEDKLGAEGYAYTRDLMMQLQDKSFDKHFDNMDTFFKRAEAGTLPSVSFLEPEWGLQVPVADHDVGINGSDYHPPTNLQPGEAFVKKIYDALTSNKEAWENTLWIINFDEHGGTYDHVSPPWGATPPWASDGTPEPQVTEGDFKFDRFGVRVPMILVSPQVPRSSVFRAPGKIPYDHTSVIATILTMMGVPKNKWGLGGRTANAPTFEHMVKSSGIREDTPSVTVNTSGTTCSTFESNAGTNDIHQRMALSIVNKAIKSKGLSDDAINKLSIPPLTDAKTPNDLSKLVKSSLDKIAAL